MRVIAILSLAALIVGCSPKYHVEDWAGAAPAMKRHGGPVCLLPGPLPAEVESTLLGRARSSQHWYGGYAGVHAGVAQAARDRGADAVVDLHSRQRMGFIAFARPDAYGWAVKLKDPSSFDCIALGGKIDPGAANTSLARAPAVTGGGAYDECMSRVMRITDPALRLQSMAACDSAR